MTQPVKILFVCLGNICRSPLAEGLFLHKLKKRGLETQFIVDSAGTIAQHRGENPDTRTLKNAQSHGIALEHKARLFTAADFNNFDLILVMDRQNKEDVLALAHNDNHTKKVRLMREYDSENPGADLPDPWFGGEAGFENIYNILDKSTSQLLEQLSSQNS